jgi:hypothetical protein
MVNVIVARMTVTFDFVTALSVVLGARDIASVPEKLAFTQMTELFVAMLETKNLICAPMRPPTGTYKDPIVTFTDVCDPAKADPSPVKVKVIEPAVTAVPPVFRTFTVAIIQRFGRTCVEFVNTVSMMMLAWDWM